MVPRVSVSTRSWLSISPPLIWSLPLFMAPGGWEVKLTFAILEILARASPLKP